MYVCKNNTIIGKINVGPRLTKSWDWSKINCESSNQSQFCSLLSLMYIIANKLRLISTLCKDRPLIIARPGYDIKWETCLVFTNCSASRRSLLLAWFDDQPPLQVLDCESTFNKRDLQNSSCSWYNDIWCMRMSSLYNLSALELRLYASTVQSCQVHKQTQQFSGWIF